MLIVGSPHKIIEIRWPGFAYVKQGSMGLKVDLKLKIIATGRTMSHTKPEAAKPLAPLGRQFKKQDEERAQEFC